MKCANRDALRSTIRQVLARPGPVLCEIMAQVDQRILPAVASRLLPDGTMRSNALHQMAPEIGIEFAELAKELD